MQLKTTNRQKIEEVPYGVYVWRCADGEYAGDGDGNVMNIFCIKNDPVALRKLVEAAKHYGVFDGGKPVWWSGSRPVSDEEFEEQVARQKSGLVPDKYDIGAIAEQARLERIARQQ